MRSSAVILIVVLAGCGGFIPYPQHGRFGNVALAQAPEVTEAGAAEMVPGDTEKALSPWGGELQSPPAIAPAEAPFLPGTMHGDDTPYNSERIQLQKAPRVNSDELFDVVMNCYPLQSTFDLNVKLTAKANSTSGANPEDDDYVSDKSYVGIVASMPLYSSSELDRRTNREATRRKETAAAIAAFSGAIAKRNEQLRLLSLYRALEQRSRKRVATGIVSATEQIGYLEKVAQANTALIQAESDILQHRLTIVSRCESGKANKLNAWLKKVAQFKGVD